MNTDNMKKRLRRHLKPAWLGTLRRTTPLSSVLGFDRGTPVDRYYIDRFLGSFSSEIRGRVLEIQDSGYTEQFGHHVLRRDVLDINSDNKQATIVADLAAADQIGADSFDCIILTQTLQCIYDTPMAVHHTHRILRPGGVLLATVPTLGSMTSSRPLEKYWRFTAPGCRKLFGKSFGSENVTVRGYGNILSAIALLTGIAAEELRARELGYNDEDFPVMVGIHAMKAQPESTAA
jgi:SAM-dependent methyltransferase